MESVKELVKRYLDENQVEYEEIHHDPAGSAEEYHNILGTDYEQQAKALFIRYKKSGAKGFVIVALPANKKADLSKINSAIRSKSVRLANVEQLKEITGCNFGELPPLAKAFGLELVMDKDLLNVSKIYFNAGNLSYSIAISPIVLQQLEDPIMVEL